eukprot:864281-Amphidinium_carterae.1
MEAKTPEQRRRSPSPMDRKWSKSPRRNSPSRGNDRRRSSSGSRDRKPRQSNRSNSPRRSPGRSPQRSSMRSPRGRQSPRSPRSPNNRSPRSDRSKSPRYIEAKRQGICYDWLQKKCKKGDSCKFKHQEPDMNKRSAAPVEMPKTVDSAGKEICRYHLQGKCSRGDKCKYSHGQPEGQDAKKAENRKTTPPPRKKSPAAPVETIEEISIEPTEVCTTMYWSDDEASDMEPVAPSRQKNPSVKHVSFNDKVEVKEYQVDNLQVGLTTTLRKRWRAKAMPIDASAQRSFKAEKDAVKSVNG